MPRILLCFRCVLDAITSFYVVRPPPPASEAAWNRTIPGCFSFFQKMLHRNRLGTLYCHEGDWSWIYFFNGQCADAAGTALWQWLGQQRR